MEIPKREDCIHRGVCKYDDPMCPCDCGYFEQLHKPAELNYLTTKEAEMPLDMALLQLALGLETCKTKAEVVRLLMDAVELGRRGK